MIVQQVKEDISNKKPIMKVLPSFQALDLVKSPSVILKIDGEFTDVIYDDGRAIALNKWGTARMDYPALNELCEDLKKHPEIRQMEIKCENHAWDWDSDKPLPVNKFIHFAKGGDASLYPSIRIALWEIVSINGQSCTLVSYEQQLKVLETLFQTNHYCYVPKHICPKVEADLEVFWERYVKTLGFEGLVARCGGEIFKIKPISEMDVVVLGVQKNKSFQRGMISTLHFGLMNPNGTFVEVGDAAGIDHKTARALWALTQPPYKVGEDNDYVWVKPFVVANIKFTDIFRGTQNNTFTFDQATQRYVQSGVQTLIRLRHPRVAGFRKDKKATTIDVGLNQVPLETSVDGEVQ